MSNSLIPHTFVPGTKAKAQEVNANFIALAEEIQDTQTTVSTRFTQVHNEILDTKDYVDVNFTDINMANNKMMTNVIIKAPNGVATYNTQTVTVKSGLRVLAPSGYNDDGRYLSIDYTLANDVSKTLTSFTNTKTTVFLNLNGTLDVVLSSLVFYKDTSNTTNGAYKYLNNKWYTYSSTESLWQEASVIPVADITWDSDGLISNLYCYPISRNIISADLSITERLNSLVPSNVDYVVESGTVNEINYRKYKSGFIEYFGHVTINTSYGSNRSYTHTIDFPESITVHSAHVIPNLCLFCGSTPVHTSTQIKFELNNYSSSAATLGDFFWEVKGKLL